MIALKIISILIVLNLCLGTWYYKEDKICDPQSQNSIPFSGFKISRQYKIDGLVPKPMHFLSIAHCRNGKIDYERTFRTNSSGDIDWSKPFCMLKPTTISNDLVPGKSNASQNVSLDMGRGLSYENDSRGSRIHLRKNFPRIAKKFKNGFKEKLKGKFEKQLENHTEGKFVQYTGKKTKSQQDYRKKIGLQSSLKRESQNVVCFKMARRRRYAKRSISFYMPHTFVGGLFECPIPYSKKMEILKSFSTSKYLEIFDFECDVSIAKLISPLIAADSTKQWLQFNFFSFNPSLIQKIPYLTTASPLNLRFSLSDTPDMLADTWGSNIDINENYVYNDLDLNVISKAIAISADYLNKLLLPVNLGKIFENNIRKTKLDVWENPTLDPNNYFNDKIGNCSIDQKANLLLSSYSSRLTALSLLHNLQKIWDNILNGNSRQEIKYDALVSQRSFS